MGSRHTPTPGQWTAEKGISVLGDPDRWSVFVQQDRQYLLATIENGAPGDTMETEGANARLIAAAPDLLAACQAALHELEAHDSTECSGECGASSPICTGCIKRKLRSALSAATEKGTPNG